MRFFLKDTIFSTNIFNSYKYWGDKVLYLIRSEAVESKKVIFLTNLQLKAMLMCSDFPLVKKETTKFVNWPLDLGPYLIDVEA